MQEKLPSRHHQGIALLIMLTIFVLALTTIAINRLSLNQVQTSRHTDDQQLLQSARDAITGYAFYRVFSTQPLTLPCPDLSNPADGSGDGDCSQTGAFPYRDFNLAVQYDSKSQPIQYTVLDDSDPITSDVEDFLCPANIPNELRIRLQGGETQEQPKDGEEFASPQILEITAEQLCPAA
jgi:hypothetical protein